MSKFLEREKHRQAALKRSSSLFTRPARKDGVYKRKDRPFCLPEELSHENLYEGIRDPVINFFFQKSIKWHDGIERAPSNHLCDSQVCCVNFLFPFSAQPDALRVLLKPIFPDVSRILPIEDDHFVTFEWIGQQNYLGERTGRAKTRTRGANFTSADAAVLFEKEGGKRHLLLIEWKYTESYSGTSLKKSKAGTDRTTIYRPLYEVLDCPLDKSRIPSFDALFYEPFYQFMRQQFLAHQIEKVHELGATSSSVLHIVPENNAEFTSVTSPKLRVLGSSATVVWKSLLRQPTNFVSVTTQSLFGHLSVSKFSHLTDWWKYIKERYDWIQ